VYVLGISAFQHGAAAALLKDGVPVSAAQEERFTRRRRDASFPSRAIRSCLGAAGIPASELDHVVFYEKPMRRFERLLVSQLRAFPRSAKPFSRTMFTWLGDRLWLKSRIADELGIPIQKVLFTEHAVSHAAAAFLASPFDEAAILVVDEEGEWATTSLARGKGGEVEVLEEIHFPHSLGRVYAAITDFLGFDSGEGGEGRVMALAAYGQPRFASEMESLLGLRDDGSFEVDASAFRYPFDPERTFGEGLTDLLGEPRKPNDPLRMGGDDTRDADLAASLQAALESALLGLCRALHRRVPVDALCLAGEVAYNTVAVGRLLRDGPFERLFVPPAAGCEGGALGAALSASSALDGGRRAWVAEHAFLGEELLEDPGEDAVELADDDAAVDALLERLLAGKIVGWARGRFEWGPRSLGHRSLLVDPRREDLAQRLGQAIKPRETLRTFDPAVTEEAAGDLFDLPEGGRWAARFCQVTVPAAETTRERAPTVVHVDGSSRPLVVRAETDPLFHRLLTRFGEATGLPMLLHTSLNLRGDPIARGESDARAVLERSDLDALVVERRLYERSESGR